MLSLVKPVLWFCALFLSAGFVAFDVDVRAFAGVKKLGATLLSAAHESQLNDKPGFILEEKILLEKE